MAIPEFVTHYYLADRRPFQNLSDLNADELALVLRDLNDVAVTGATNRRFGPRYMELRRATEQRMRDLFVNRGGRPRRRSPHYFVLGESPWFRGLYGTNAAEVRIPLADLPDDATSVTYPDSFVAMGLLPRFGIEVDERPYHGAVFLLSELSDLLDRYELPDQAPAADYIGYHRRAGEHFIEIQLWSDDPVRAHLASAPGRDTAAGS